MPRRFLAHVCIRGVRTCTASPDPAACLSLTCRRHVRYVAEEIATRHRPVDYEASRIESADGEEFADGVVASEVRAAAQDTACTPPVPFVGQVHGSRRALSPRSALSFTFADPSATPRSCPRLREHCLAV